MHTREQGFKPGYDQNALKQEEIRLSTKYGVLCTYTSFVAVEDGEKTEKESASADGKPPVAEAIEEEKEEEQRQSRTSSLRAPSPRAKGCSRDRCRSRKCKKKKCCKRKECCEKKKCSKMPCAAKKSCCSRPSPSMSSSLSSSSASKMAATGDASSTAAAKVGLAGLLLKQKFDGHWALEALLANFANLNKKDVDEAKPDGMSDDVWATLVALAWLDIKHADQAVKWDLVAKKAKRWLRKQKVDIDAQFPAAKEFVTKKKAKMG
eukprot:TRINITY_DN1525_c0_g2_i1.p1 TRINITY_DN1525_c0_g2~~TRINITY_DN1525_c0_g2_i1.p1  ORF type:complete len:264 (+),score=67.56 TRINITY_DN1525_c0_g2_i1:430-1221(+)